MANYSRLHGNNNLVQNVTLRNTPHPLDLTGRNATIDNVLIENQGWYGTLQYPAVFMRTVDSMVSNVELRHTGNVGLEHTLWKYDADHIYCECTHLLSHTVTHCRATATLARCSWASGAGWLQSPMRAG